MRLLLCSWFLRPGQRPDLLRPTGGSGQAGVVLNALDELGAARNRELGREIRSLEDLGYACDELDLRQYFGEPGRLAERLHGLDLVWAVGGNSFVLARSMAQAGFGAAVRQRLDDPSFVYGGYSAGACVAGPDLAGIELVDDPEVIPEGYAAETEPVGLWLVPFRVVPHWRSDHPESGRIELVDEHLAAAGLDYRRLRDGQALAVDGSAIARIDL
jgi:dipeptidase E